MSGDEFDHWLDESIRAAVPLPDRARFVDQVMQRVSHAEVEPRLQWQPAAPLPWWIQAARQPAAALACALLALLLWRPDALDALTGLFSGGASVLAPVLARAQSVLALDRPAIALGLGLLGVFLLGWASFQLYGWTERMARRAAR